MNQVFCAPNIYIIDDFLSPKELKYLHQVISERQFQQSYVDNDKGESVGLCPRHFGSLLSGQFFGLHHDMGDYDEQSGEVALPPKTVVAKRRLVTIFCYLNDFPPDAGGCTWFPSCNDLRVQPKAGRAVVFCNVTAEGLPDPRTIHAGEAVVAATETQMSEQKTPAKKNPET